MNYLEYGDKELAKITLSKLTKDLKPEDREILYLKHGLKWSNKDIGHYIGYKYRSKPYNEATIRYRVTKLMQKLIKSKES